MDPYNLKISSYRLIIMKDMNRKGKTVATVSVSFGSDQWMLPSRWKGLSDRHAVQHKKKAADQNEGGVAYFVFSNNLIFISAIFL